jgi:hypothetical protein
MTLVRNRLLAATLAVLGIFVVVACSALPGNSPAASAADSSSPTPPTATPPMGGSPSASPSFSAVPPSVWPSPPVGSIELADPARAVALVLASDPRFAQVSPLTPGLVGASAWYEVSPAKDGQFSVSVTLGSGDCQAGCINQHTWHYTVSADGQVTLVGDEGDAVEYSPPAPAAGPATLTISALAGPTCPVEQNPPASACAPRPVADAQLVVHAVDGQVVARTTTDASGSATVQLPGGVYWVEALPATGVMGTPSAMAFSVVGGQSTHLTFSYDTGIR